jgi:hypothetical protein
MLFLPNYAKFCAEKKKKEAEKENGAEKEGEVEKVDV